MKSYLKFLSRNKLYAAIEFFGLAVSLAFVILIGAYVRQQWRVARGYPEWKNTYAIGTEYNTVEMAPRSGLAELLKENVPEIEKASIYSHLLAGGKLGDSPIHNKSIVVVNPDFLDMFPIRWVSGNPEGLLESHTVAVTERFAQGTFPGEEVLGKIWEDRDGQPHTVVAVFKDLGASIFPSEDLALLQVYANEPLSRGADGGTTCFVRSDEPEDKLTADIDAVLEAHLRKSWG